MTFVATLLDASGPKYEANIKFERWTAAGTVSDAGAGTVTARYLDRVDRAEVEAFGGSVTRLDTNGRELILRLPGGSSSPLTYNIKLIQDGTL